MLSLSLGKNSNIVPMTCYRAKTFHCALWLLRNATILAGHAGIDGPNEALVTLEELIRIAIAESQDFHAVSAKVKKVWFPFEDREEYGFEDEPAVACWLGKVFHFHQGRNVWGANNWPFGGKAPNWSNTYPGAESFCSELADAKAKIEKLRRQGSRWGIEELPVIAISGQNNSLIVGEINTDVPLTGFLPSRRKLLTLQDLGLHFNPPSPNSIFRIVSRPSVLIPAELPFYRHQSKSQGGGYFLNWHMSIADQDLNAVLALICRITKAIQREARLTSGMTSLTL